MQPFTTLRAAAAPFDLANCDTDKILPARFLRKPRRAGYGNFLFHDLRADPLFTLGRPGFAQAKILVAERNFGCGSSREGAVYALADWGIRAVIAPSFGDIFAGNCSKNGVAAIRLPADTAAALRLALHAQPGAEIAIDMERQTVTGPDGAGHHFEIDPFVKHCLLNGLDDIGLTLQHAERIAAFEAALGLECPWIATPSAS